MDNTKTLRLSPGSWRLATTWLMILAAMGHPAAGQAQVVTATENILYAFAAGVDGESPNDLVPYSDGNFYGVTSNTFFRITPAGTLTTLFTFCTAQNLCPNGKPTPAGLTLGGDGNFYGLTASSAGPAAPAFFQITPSGAYTTITSLTGSDGNPAGAIPSAGAKLTLGADGNFYGVDAGYTGTSGSVFRITPAGVFTALHEFSATSGGMNSDGATPHGRLVQAADGNLYGTTYLGGPYGAGTIFRITPGGALTSIYAFGTDGGVGTSNRDGLNPFAGLVQGSDGYLYGGTPSGGQGGLGTLFRITTSGVLTPLHQFNRASNLTLSVAASPASISLGQSVVLTWSLAGTITAEGGGPKQSLLQGLDGNFYGFADEVQSGSDSVFQLTPTGGFTIILPPPSGETEPDSLFQTSDGKFYGTNYYGGSTGDYGSVFELTVGESLFPTPCTPSIYPASGGGAWSGAQAVNGTLAVTPTAIGTYYYSLTCSFPGNANDPTVGPITATLNVGPAALPVYSAGELSIPVVAIGSVSYSNMVVTVGTIVSGPSGSSPIGSQVTYDPASNQLSIPVVMVGSTTYYNVVITIANLVSIGDVAGADVYFDADLAISSVQLLGGSVYGDVVVTVGGIVSVADGMPKDVRDQYDSSTNTLFIPAVQVGNHVYTNVTITVGKLVSIGGVLI